MATFTAGTSFTDGVTGDVTAAKLNALVANATPLSNLITDRTAKTSATGADIALIADSADSNNLKKITLTNLFNNISTGTGTAAAPAIVPTGDTNTGIFFPAADTIAFSEGGTESMRIDSSGNVGIGTTSPNIEGGGGLYLTANGGSSRGNIVAETSAANANGTLMGIFGFSATTQDTGHRTPSQIFGELEGTTSNKRGGRLCFYTKPDNSSSLTERLRIDSSGNLLWNQATSLTNQSGIVLNGTAGSMGFHLRHNNATAGRFRKMGIDSSNNCLMYDQNDTGVYIANGATSWTANSDERLKTQLTPFENAVDKLNSIRVGTGRYLTDPEDTSRSFLIAQDVQPILPEAVSEKDGYLGVSYTDLIPLLIAGIKELKAKNDILESKVAALEAA